MKKILITAITCICILFLFEMENAAQAPQGMNYQAVIRGSDHVPVPDQAISLRFTILDAGNTAIYQETQELTTNASGLVTAVIGTGDPGSFASIDWSTGGYSLKVELDPDGSGPASFSLSGEEALQSVPYALFGEDSDADPVNEIQDLEINSNILKITNNASASSIDLSPYLDNTDSWKTNGNHIYFNEGNVGIGNSSPAGKLEVVGDGSQSDETALFEVRRNDGLTVFAVYPDGIRAYVGDPQGKGSKGGFAVGGFDPGKAGYTHEFLRVTPDSVRVYIDQPAKGSKGGFAVGGFNPGKSEPVNFLDLTPENYFIGHESGSSLTTGLYNSFLGYQSGRSNTEGSNNAFFGYQAGYSNTTGDRNLFLGLWSGFTNSTGSNNTFLGIEAGRMNSTGTYNTFVGSYSGTLNTGGNDNAFVGYYSGYNNTTGEGNSFLGNYAGYKNSTGNYNSFIGYRAGYNNNANYNSFMGYQTGYSTTSGGYNAFIGYYSGYANTTGASGVFLGYMSGRYNQGGSNNVFIGNRAGYFNQSGGSNIFLGTSAGYSNTASNNVFIGYESGFSNTGGTTNNFIGYQAGRSNTTGNSNVFIGNQSGYDNQSSVDNVFIGYLSGATHTTGNNNLFMGSRAGRYSVAGENNVFLGVNAGMGNDSGSGNTFIGYRSGENNTTGYSNVFISTGSGINNTSGYSNVLIGDQAGVNNTTGYENVVIGRIAGFSNQTGSHNVFLGYAAGYGETGSNRLHIGYPTLIYGEFDNRRVGIGTTNPVSILQAAGDLVLGNDANNTKFIFHSRTAANGDFLNITSDDANGNWKWSDGIILTRNGNVVIGGGNAGSFRLYVTGTAYSTGGWQASDARFKEDVSEIDGALSSVMAMQGVSYRWKQEDYPEKHFPDGRHYGVIAQEIEEVLPEVVMQVSEDEKAVSYTELVPVLIEAVKEQQSLISLQQSRIEQAELQIRELQERLDRMNSRNGKIRISKKEL